MPRQLLDESPLAALLLQLAAKGATGRIVIGGRSLVLNAGGIAEVLPAAHDESLEELWVKTGRIAEADLARYQKAAADGHFSLPHLLVRRGILTESELSQARRALFVDRLVRGLRATAEREPARSSFVPSEPGTTQGAALPLLPILLDALARSAASADAGVVGANLNHRVEWLRGPHEAGARTWADFGDVPERPAVSTVLAKRPAAAARIAALMRAGLLRLEGPGRAAPSLPPPASSVPAPAPRLAAIPDPRESMRSPGAQLVASIRPPRLRLDPGQAYASEEPLEPTPLPALPLPSLTLDDPLLPLERKIAELEASGAPGPERARAFVSFANLWRDRFFAIERACRAFREAAAADPRDSGVLQQAALHCHYLGQPELAMQYARAAVLAAGLPIERSSAQRLRAAIARAAGDVDACIEALCEAAADDPDSPEPHEQVALLQLEQGNLDGANAHARLAATALDESAGERSIALLAFAWSLKPSDAATAFEYASALDGTGRRHGAVAVLSETASRVSDRDQRRKLRLAAAERAEAAQKSDVAAELLLDAFDAEPHFDLLYAPLEEDLRQLGSAEYRALVLEDVATACADEQRALWLERAGRALLEAEDQREAALWLVLEALLTDPARPEPLGLLREHARSDRELVLLAYGLRAVIAVQLEHAPRETEGLLRELGELAETALQNTHVALAAWQQLASNVAPGDPEAADACERLSARAAAERAELEACQQALAEAEGSARAELYTRIAELLPDRAEQKAGRIRALRSALEAGSGDESVRARLETLHGLNRDAEALAAFLAEQAELAQDRNERVRLLSRLAAVQTVREDTGAVVASCETILAIDPSNRIAVARLARAGRKIGDARLLSRALGLYLPLCRSERERARIHAQLAHAEEQAGRYAEAATHAAEALALDPSVPDAGLVLLRHAQRIDPRAALRGLLALEAALGPLRPLLAAEVQLAQASFDRATLERVVALWAEALPSDGAAQRARVLLLCETGPADALVDAALAAIERMPSPEVLDAALRALTRLEQQAQADAGCRLALRIAEAQGRPDPALARRAVALAKLAAQPELYVTALELLAEFGPAHERSAVLIELGELHRERQAHAEETRALLRVLEGGERPAKVLARLRDLFVQAGDASRWLGVGGLLLETQRNRAQRRELLFELAAVAGSRLSDLERADFYLRAVVAENADDQHTLRSALGLWFTFLDARSAIERCLAIAEGCGAELASRIHLWCAVTAEQRLSDPALALEIARVAALAWPSYAEPLLVVERLTLAAQDARTALATYDGLIAAASGPHGKRALLYRAGRWLERAGLLDEALRRYEQAFELAPTTGAAFKSLARVARQTGQLVRVVPCYERLAAHVREGRARFLLLSSAGELCLTELRDEPRGIDLLIRANELSDRFELDTKVLEASRALARREPNAARAALERFTGQLTDRASALFVGEDKVRTLMQLANICSEDLGRHVQALAQIDEALEIARREGVSDALAAAAENERRSVIERGGVELSNAPPALRVSVPLQRESLDELGMLDEASGQAPEQAHELADARARVHERDHEHESAGEWDRSDDFALRSRDALLRAVQAEPWRTEALRALLELGESGPESTMVRALVASFDESVPRAAQPRVAASAWRGAALRDAIGPAHPEDVAHLLGSLWESARVIPRIRRPLHSYGVSEQDRISRITVGPIADAYAKAARALDLSDVPVYIAREDPGGPRALPTHPPAVLTGRGLQQDEQRLHYGMAHALWLAQPRHVLTCVMPADDARDLLLAAQVAFDPSAKHGGASVAVKELAAALWQSVPMREQRLFAEILRARRGQLDYDELRGRTRAAAARAALLCTLAIGTALRALGESEPELAGLDVSQEAGFADAARRSQAFADTIRVALSETFVAAATRHSLPPR